MIGYPFYLDLLSNKIPVDLYPNPNAIYYIENDIVNDNFNFEFLYLLCINPNAISLIEKYIYMFDGICWDYLSENPNAIHILKNNLDKVKWNYLLVNKNALHLFEKNLDKGYWKWLSQNSNAMHILEKHLNKVEWRYLSCNPNIFKPVYDYNAIKLHFHELHKKLATLFYHPLRMNVEYTLFCSDDLEYEKQFDKPVISVLKQQRVM